MITHNEEIKVLRILGLVLLTLFTTNPIFGQTISNTTEEKTIKGLVSDEDDVLEGVNVIQKGTKVGTTTNKKGEFTFPVELKKGDILIFSYLGYENQEITIKEKTTFINLVLTGDLVEMTGALNSTKRYKTKRKN